MPAGHEQLRLLQEALELLPAAAGQVGLRSNTSGYQQELLKYCAEGKHPKFRVIKFAVGVGNHIALSPQLLFEEIIRADSYLGNLGLQGRRATG